MPCEELWFLTSRVDIRLSHRDNARGLTVFDSLMPQGFSPPLHIHHGESETMYILDGDFRFVMNGEFRTVTAGDVLHLPADSEHTFVVLSPQGGRFLAYTDGHGRFENMVREVSRPATRPGLPDPVAPTAADEEALLAACRKYDLELRGPPLTL